MSTSLPHLSSEVEAGEAVKHALRMAGTRLAGSDSPRAALRPVLARRLPVEPTRVERHSLHYDWMDQPVTSWHVTLFVDPDQKPVYPVYELMSEAEDFLSKNFGDSFFLVPALLAGAEH